MSTVSNILNLLAIVVCLATVILVRGSRKQTVERMEAVKDLFPVVQVQRQSSPYYKYPPHAATPNVALPVGDDRWEPVDGSYPPDMANGGIFVSLHGSGGATLLRQRISHGQKTVVFGNMPSCQITSIILQDGEGKVLASNPQPHSPVLHQGDTFHIDMDVPWPLIPKP